MTALSAAQQYVVGEPPVLPEGVAWPEIRYEIDDLGTLPFAEISRRTTKSAAEKAAVDGAPSCVGYAAVVRVEGEERPAQRWYAICDGAGMWAASRAEAERRIAEHAEFGAWFWMEKVGWQLAGDQCPDRNGRMRQVIRCGGTHYVIGNEGAGGMRGFGGHQFQFRLIPSGRDVLSTNVWYQGVIPAEFRGLLPDNAERVESPQESRDKAVHAEWQKKWAERQKAQAELRASLAPFSGSGREHPLPDQVLMVVEDMDEDYDAAVGDTRTVTRDLDAATVMTSEYQGYAGYGMGDDWHRPVLDLDLPAQLIPSSTEGHFHLFIDKPMKWDTYVQLLEALAAADIVEDGYVKASIERGHTAVRMPWVKKGAPKPPPAATDGVSS